MTTPPSPEHPPERTLRFPPRLGLAILALLSLQLALGYLQGALLHRQQEELRDLRADIQDLTAAIDQGYGAEDTGGAEPSPWRPAGPRRRAHRPPRPYALASRAVLEGDEEDRQRKELQQSRDSAKKAVEDARKAQSQVSFEENARKAEVAKQVGQATGQWQKWSLVGLGLLAGAFLVRAWLRRRG